MAVSTLPAPSDSILDQVTRAAARHKTIVLTPDEVEALRNSVRNSGGGDLTGGDPTGGYTFTFGFNLRGVGMVVRCNDIYHFRSAWLVVSSRAATPREEAVTLIAQAGEALGKGDRALARNLVDAARAYTALEALVAGEDDRLRELSEALAA